MGGLTFKIVSLSILFVFINFLQMIIEEEYSFIEMHKDFAKTHSNEGAIEYIFVY